MYITKPQGAPCLFSSDNLPAKRCILFASSCQPGIVPKMGVALISKFERGESSHRKHALGVAGGARDHPKVMDFVTKLQISC